MAGSLERIARRLGVSVSTVSRALAGKPGVSARRRAEIRALAQEMGCVLNPHASSLRRRRGTGLTLVSAFRPSRIGAMRHHALMAAARREFDPVRAVVIAEDEPLDQVVREAASRCPQAIVISSVGGTVEDATLALLKREAIALVAMDCAIPGADTVRVDRVSGMYQAARLLLLSGCKDAVFFSRGGLSQPDARIQGIRLAYQSLDYDPDTVSLVPVCSDGFAAGYQAAADCLRRRPADGIFAYDDELAVGALRAVQDAGLRSPHDVRVIGFDNLPMTAYLACPLTTVAQPVEPVSETVVDVCRQRLQDPAAPARSTSLRTELVVRASAPLPTNVARTRVFETPS